MSGLVLADTKSYITDNQLVHGFGMQKCTGHELLLQVCRFAILGTAPSSKAVWAPKSR